MREALELGLVAFSAVFVVVDPFAAIPFFLALTAKEDEERRRATARRAALVAGGVLAGFALAGAVVFQLVGVTLAAFKIAGGALLLLTAADMVRTRHPSTRITEGEVEEGASREDVAVVPLAMPILAGPGAMATVVVLMGRARDERAWLAIPVLLAIALTAFLSYLLLAGAARVARVMGRTGLNIVERIAGLLLAAIAIQFIVDGLGEAMPAILGRIRG
ncbi:MAG TPA: MarC family protein [Anaeromyxobacteraceae bacterium]